MHKVMRIGTRKSELALAQTELFIEACRAVEPDFSYEIVEMSTTGDQILERPLYEFSGKGMFVTAFEDALLADMIDVAVHSGKDMPEEIPEELTVAAVLPRANPCDVLVTLSGKELPKDAVIGTGSLRRQVQIQTLLGCRTVNLRGNVGTRLRKLQNGEVDGLILAAAGLERLGILPKDGGEAEGFLFRRLDTDEFLPAAAQGIIAVESRKGGPFEALLTQINDPETMRCFLAERVYLARIGAGCQQPTAAYARFRDGQVYMDAAYWEKGKRIYFSDQAAPEMAQQLAEHLAECVMAERKGEKNVAGHVYLVGAGPGAGELITVRGLELLRTCDAVIYDRLSGGELLSEVSCDCECIYAGKKAGSHSMKQEEINRMLVRKAQEGKQVVRLKGGDPFVFGRGGEEAECLLEAGIPFTVVPGVTSSVAAAELAGIPVTHREMSRSFHVITAHTTQKAPEEIRSYLSGQIMSLRDTEGTLVFLMGLSSLEIICELLLESGRSPQLPAAVIGSSSQFCETVVRGTLADLAAKTRESHVESPAVIVVGPCAALSLRAEGRLPLQGVRVGLTGTRAIVEKIGKILRREGAETLFVQEMLIDPLPGQDVYFKNLSSYTWLAFTSANGVRLFFEQMHHRKLDVRILSHLKIAAVGSGTAQMLEQYGILADLIPRSYTVAALAEGLLHCLVPERDRILLYQAKEGNPILQEELSEAGIAVTQAEAYECRARMLCDKEELRTLSYLTFASSSGVRAFADEYPYIFSESEMHQVKAAAIGSQTARALADAGCRNYLTAECFTAQGLADVIIQDGKERWSRE